MKRMFVGFVAAALLVPGLVSAAEWNIDASHSNVNFKIRHLVSRVTGSFNDISGQIQFDPEKATEGSVEITIPVASIDTNNEKRDGHLKNEDFFDEPNHPTLTFKSTKFGELKDGKMTVEGMLTMRGVEKPVTLDVEFLGAAPGMRGGQVAGFEVSGKINRKDWGIEWNRALDKGGAVLGDDVEIMINIEATTA